MAYGCGAVYVLSRRGHFPGFALRPQPLTLEVVAVAQRFPWAFWVYGCAAARCACMLKRCRIYSCANVRVCSPAGCGCVRVFTPRRRCARSSFSSNHLDGHAERCSGGRGAPESPRFLHGGAYRGQRARHLALRGTLAPGRPASGIRIYADKGYASAENRAAVRRVGRRDRIMR